MLAFIYLIIYAVETPIIAVILREHMQELDVRRRCTLSQGNIWMAIAITYIPGSKI